MHYRTGAGIGLAALLLASCGGGGGGGTNTPAPSNSAPQITSSASFTVPENTSATVFTASAVDANGDTVSFSISGGADAEAFDINSATGAVTFVTAPDFEAPSDSDANNVYAFTLRATDGRGGTATQSVTVTVSDVDEAGSGVRYRDRIFTNVTAQRSIPYASVDGTTLRMDVFTPQNDTDNDRPVMILAFPGGFVDGQRQDMEDVAVDFALRGYVGVTIDYRLLDSDPTTATELALASVVATHDLFAAVRFFRADAAGANTYGTRGDAILVGGASAGANMAVLAAVIDPADTIGMADVQAYLDSNGGVFGTVGDNDGVSSEVQGAFVVAGALADTGLIDANAAPVYAAHQEFDPIVPCGTGQEGEYFTGLSVSGPCAMQPVFEAAGVPFGLTLIAGAVGHIDFSDQDADAIANAAASFFYTQVISPE